MDLKDNIVGYWDLRAQGYSLANREEFADKPYGSHCEATERFIEGHNQWNQFQETISRKNQ